MNQDKRVEIFRRFKEANPKPETELNFDSPFELLIAVILSAQATDISVNKVTAKLFPVASTPADMMQLGVEGITPYIRTIGLFNAKARNVIATCRILCEQHDGEVPADREALEALPGVGRKTANVVLNTAFGQLAMAVDTHIFRVSNRTGMAPGKNVVDVEHKLMRLVPKDYLLDAHHWLLLHGRYVCLARTPKCPDCPIRDLCDYRSKTEPGQTGASKKAAAKKAAASKKGSKKVALKKAGASKIGAKKVAAKKPGASKVGTKKAASKKTGAGKIGAKKVAMEKVELSRNKVSKKSANEAPS